MNPTARRFGVTARDSASDSERVLAEGVSAAMTIPDVVKDVRACQPQRVSNPIECEYRATNCVRTSGGTSGLGAGQERMSASIAKWRQSDMRRNATRSSRA
jgi:nitrogenase subunit NifH